MLADLILSSLICFKIFLANFVVSKGGCITDQSCDITVTSQGDSRFCYCSQLTNSTVYYLPQQDVWKMAASMPRVRYRYMAARVNEYLYIAGGRYLDETIVPEIGQCAIIL